MEEVTISRTEKDGISTRNNCFFTPGGLNFVIERVFLGRVFEPFLLAGAGFVYEEFDLTPLSFQHPSPSGEGIRDFALRGNTGVRF